MDQHAFTPGVRIEDALLSAEVAIEYANEWSLSWWMMSMDMRKAFDIVEHSAVFKTLEKRSMPKKYIELLKILYSS